MHDVPTRQLIALSVALLAFFAAPCRGADESRAAKVDKQLRAAKLMQTALAASAAKSDAWKKLEDEYAALADRYPRDVTVIDARAEFLWDIGEHSRAVAEWQRAEQIEPMNPRILGHLGESALALGDPRKAAAFHERAVASDPGNATRHFALANVWFLFRHELMEPAHPDEESLLRGALAHFSDASRLAPKNLEYARAYAETFYAISNPDWPAALEAWKRVERLSTEKDFALGHLARVHLHMGHIDASRQCLDRMQSPDYQILKARLSERLDALQADKLKATGRAPRSRGDGP